MTAIAAAPHVDGRLDAMAAQLAEITEELHAQRAPREQFTELFGELSHVMGPAMATISERLARLEADGWFEFAGHGAGVMGKVVEGSS